MIKSNRGCRVAPLSCRHCSVFLLSSWHETPRLASPTSASVVIEVRFYFGRRSSDTTLKFLFVHFHGSLFYPTLATRRHAGWETIFRRKTFLGD